MMNYLAVGAMEEFNGPLAQQDWSSRLRTGRTGVRILDGSPIWEGYIMQGELDPAVMGFIWFIIVFMLAWLATCLIGGK